MAQLSVAERLQRIVVGEMSPCEGFLALLDRHQGRFAAEEGTRLDFKSRINLDDQSAIAETARDLLAFANSEGGVVLVGVTDSAQLVGYSLEEPERLRDQLGPFMGTRIEYDLVSCEGSVRGRQTKFLAIVVKRSVASYPILLRRDVEFRRTLSKVKYLRGSLFYRENDETLVEPPHGDIDGRALELGFTGGAPRTRSSFILKEDRPLLRLYENINDRFFGRDTELAELISKFDDPRGKGVSLAGIGGVGKTELAITLVRRLLELGRFRIIYSGSAKRTVLSAAGPQNTDPIFVDRPSFLRDLAAWLGFSPADLSLERLQDRCIEELRRHDRVLLFVDNLETVTDLELLTFLDNELPSNCWLVTTARVHRIRNFVFPKELTALGHRDAARLLRYELKRQGLAQLSATPVAELERRSEQLYFHPLALRWFAWACRRDHTLWDRGAEKVDRAQLEEFCVAQTLGSLSAQTRRVLSAIVATSAVTETTVECISGTSRVPPAEVEVALYELECAGLVVPVLSEVSGAQVYLAAPLAEGPAADLARAKGWEREYTTNLKLFLKAPAAGSGDAVVKDLMEFPLWRVRNLVMSEIADLDARVKRIEPRCPAEQRWYLKALLAECQRHQHNVVSSDDIYKEAAKQLLNQGAIRKGDRAKIQVLLEAATVAKARANTSQQLGRALEYLTAIEHTDFAPHRVLGMIAEYSAAVGDLARYRETKKRAEDYLAESGQRLSLTQETGLREALGRASDHAARSGRKTK